MFRKAEWVFETHGTVNRVHVVIHMEALENLVKLELADNVDERARDRIKALRSAIKTKVLRGY